MAAGVVPAEVAGTHAADLPGVVTALAGVGLLCAALWIGFRGRPRRVQALAVPVVLVILQWGVLPAVEAGLATSAPRPAVPPARALGIAGARDVTFPAADGVRLAGWYVPGTSGAAAVLMHGSHGTRADTIGHLRILHRAGIAVLAFDARGHGASAGRTNALGWQATADVDGAVRFLRMQTGVDRNRIVAVGLSMGAEEALRAAADGVPLAAVVADGAGASTSGDRDLVAESGPLAPVARSVDWLAMRETELVSRVREPAPLRDIVGRIGVPVLLIASGAPGERTIDAAYAGWIGPWARVWSLPDAAHTRGLQADPAAYAARVLTFLQRSLRGR